MKRFNVTGLCVPEKHYMADISGKITQIKNLVDDECYFTIEKPIKYGKTTILKFLEKALINEYTVISVNFGKFDADCFKSSKQFCHEFIKHVANALTISGYKIDYIKKWADYNVTDMLALNYHIGKMCKNKKVVLIIDDADKNSQNIIFLDFLSVLRAKFTEKIKKEDYIFHSVIIASVFDIKNIKLPVQTYHSPWNIATNFNIDMSFNPTEIATMLNEYETEHHTGMDIIAISEEIYNYTAGYPFLVSRICQCIDEELNKEWNKEGIQKTYKKIFDVIV